MTFASPSARTDRGAPVPRLADRAFEACLLLLVASLPIAQPHAEFRGYGIPVADVLFPLAAAAFAAAWLGGRPLRRSSLYGALALYAGAMVCSTLASTDRAASVTKLAGEFYLLGLAVLTINYVDSMTSAKRLCLAWLTGTAICVAAGAAGLAFFAAGARDPAVNPFLDSHGSLPAGSYPRIMASFVNANMLCVYLAASLGLTLAAGRLRWLPATAARVLTTAVVVIAFASLSPGLGGIALVTGLWWAGDLQRRNRHRSRLVTAAAWCVALVFVVAAVIPLSASAPVSPRVLTWVAAWRTFLAHPWFGIGLGLGVADVRYVNASGLLEQLTDAHNVWLSVLAQNGIVGLAAFCAVIVALVRRPSDGGEAGTLAVGVWLAFAGGFLYQSLTGSFEDARHVWVLAGLMASVRGSQFGDHLSHGQARRQSRRLDA